MTPDPLPTMTDQVVAMRDGTALCAEVSAKNKQGVYGGFRRVIVTDKRHTQAAPQFVEHGSEDRERFAVGATACLFSERPTPDLEIVETRVYRGANVWSYDKSIHLVVDLGVLEGYPTDTLPGFTDRLVEFRRPRAQ